MTDEEIRELLDGRTAPLSQESATTQLQAAAPALAREVLRLRAELARTDAGATEIYRERCAEEDRAHAAESEVLRLTPLLADAERRIARLERILAVERGDASAAPEGWRDESAPLARRCSWVRRVFRETGGLEWLLQVWWDGAWKWETNGLPAPRHQGTAPTALEAMEAADRAAKERP